MDAFIQFLNLDQFVPGDLLVIAVLILLEGMLSCDNAVALAMQVRSLPKEQQGKALRYGILGAYVFLFIALCLATWIISQWWLKLLGGAYLLFIAGKHLFGRKHDTEGAPQHPKPFRIPGVSVFWSTVVAVELTDIAFSVDSIAAAVAFSPKFFVLLAAGLIYILVMRFAAQGFIWLLGRFPLLESAAFLAVAFIGLKLVVEFPADVLGRVQPATPAYATAAEYRHALDQGMASVFHVPHIIEVNAAAYPEPVEARFASVQEYKLAKSHWNLHGRALVKLEELGSALAVILIFAAGFLRQRRGGPPPAQPG